MFDDQAGGTNPSMRQYWPGASPSEIWSFPPSSTLLSLMLKNCPGAWMDLIFHTPAPAGTGAHCWLLFPVLFHWTTLDPLVFFSSAISRTWPLRTLWRSHPDPALTHLHLWLNLLFFSYWMRRSPGSKVAPGMSIVFPELLLTRMQVSLRTVELLTGTI